MADDSAYSQSRIFKNTFVLCIRMLITMGVALYTSRVVLKVLGIDDYGLYNIIGGIVVLLAIVSNSMRSATQRFITFELGRGNVHQVCEAFSMSMIAHFIIGAVVILIGETIGLWYVQSRLNIPEGREIAAMYVYQFSLLTTVITLIRSPYEASVISHERMSFFAYMSIVDVTLKLAIVYLLTLAQWDKLVVYAILVLLTNVIILLCYRLYCKRVFDTCDFHFVIKKDYFLKLFGFLGWNLLGASASLGTQQAGNLIINRFLGVAINAAYGVANQVNGAINSFVSNFQVAFAPQIVKLYSQNRFLEFFKLSNSSALLSYFILFIISFPIITNIDYVLSVWLIEVPKYAGIFCSLLIVYSLIDAVQAPFWIGINATGDIKTYEIWLSALLVLNIPFSYFALKWGWEPYWVLAIRVILNFITAICRCIHVRIQLDFPIKDYLTKVVFKVLIVTALSIGTWHLVPHDNLYHSFGGFILCYIISASVISTYVFLFGIGHSEREIVLTFIKRFIPVGKRNPNR